jgi:thioredoxin-like negative regulator of GroEL
MTYATVASFERLIAGPSPTLVAFHAPWDRYSHRNRPALELVAAERGLELVMLNIERCPDLAAWLGIHSAPVFRLYLGGELARAVYP